MFGALYSLCVLSGRPARIGRVSSLAVRGLGERRQPRSLLGREAAATQTTHDAP